MKVERYNVKKIFKNEKIFLLIFILFFISSWGVLPNYAINTICFSFCTGLVILGLLLLMRVGLISFGHGLNY